jgi:fructokinase
VTVAGGAGTNGNANGGAVTIRGGAKNGSGADGAVSIRPAEARVIVDTVGAGDAFTAAVVMGLLGGRPLEAMHDHAARLAAFVCGHRGATPQIPAELRA